MLPAGLNLHERKFLELARALGGQAQAAAARRGAVRPQSGRGRQRHPAGARNPCPGATIVFVEHLMRAVVELSDRVAVLNEGKLSRWAPAQGDARSARRQRLSRQSLCCLRPATFCRLRRCHRRVGRLARGRCGRDRLGDRPQRRGQDDADQRHRGPAALPAGELRFDGRDMGGVRAHDCAATASPWCPRAAAFSPACRSRRTSNWAAICGRAGPRETVPGNRLRPVSDPARQAPQLAGECRAASSRWWRSAGR